MDRLGYWLYCSARALLGLLPLRVVFVLGEALGFLCWLAAAPYRRLAMRNMEIAFGAGKSVRERRGLVRRHFISLGANLLSSVRIAGLSREEVRGLFEIEGGEIAEQLQREKRGFVFVISHLGNWELLAQAAPLLWPHVGTVYQRLGNPHIDAEMRASRARLGLALFERKEGFQGAIRMLRAGGGVGVLVDQHAGDAGVWAPFFGRLASTSSLAAMLALRTGAALLPFAVYTASRGRWKLVLEPLVEPAASRTPEALTAAINLAVERQIRKQPEDWFWVHNRWKTPKPKFLLATYKRGVAAAPSGPDDAATPPLQPFRVVVRSSNWLGDAVMSVPAVRAIKRGRPDLHLTILTPAKLAELWQTIAEVDDVISIASGESVFATAAKLRGRFEAAILFPKSLRVALEVWLAGIPRRVGYPGHRRRWLLNQVWKEKKNTPGPPRHQVHHYLRLAEFIGADIANLADSPATVPSPNGAPSSQPRASPWVPRSNDAEALKGRLKIPPRAPRPPGAPLRLGLCPGAEYGPAKRWLPERFREVMDRFQPAVACEWTLFGVPKDAPIADALLHGFTGRVRNLIGQTTLRELLAELQNCDALLTNDTGTMHLAALVGIPVVAVFGSTEPALTGPLGAQHRVLRQHVECSPCFLRDCPLDFRCMTGVTVDQALAALHSILDPPPA